MAEEQFLVRPDALRGYAGLLERNHGYVGEMREYLDGPGSQTEGLMGLMFQFQNLVEGMVASERDTLITMLTKLDGTIQGLKETADEYVDTMHPLGRLNPPGNYDELVTDSVTDVLPGVVGWINDAVAWVTRQFGHEVNVVHWLTETIGGDWGDLLSLADAWNNLAWASSDIAGNLLNGVVELDPHWDASPARSHERYRSEWIAAN